MVDHSWTKFRKHLSLFVFSPGCRIERNQMFTQSRSSRIFSVALSVQPSHHWKPRPPPWIPGRRCSWTHWPYIYIYIANVVERLNLKLISYQIVSYQILSYLFSRTACTLQLTSIPYTQTRSDRCSRRSPPVIGVAIHLCITPHVSSQLFLLGICP